MKETMLKPKKRPKSPPRLAMKSTGPILMLLSNSGEVRRDVIMKKRYFLVPTHHSLLAKEDIDNGDVFIPGVVKLILRLKVYHYSIFEFSPLTLK